MHISCWNVPTHLLNLAELQGLPNFLPKPSNIFTQIYLPYLWHFATLVQMTQKSPKDFWRRKASLLIYRDGWKNHNIRNWRTWSWVSSSGSENVKRLLRPQGQHNGIKHFVSYNTFKYTISIWKGAIIAYFPKTWLVWDEHAIYLKGFYLKVEDCQFNRYKISIPNALNI